MLRTIATFAALAALAATTIAPAHALIVMNGDGTNGAGENGSGPNGSGPNGAASGSSTLSIQSIELPAATR